MQPRTLLTDAVKALKSFACLEVQLQESAGSSGICCMRRTCKKWWGLNVGFGLSAVSQGDCDATGLALLSVCLLSPSLLSLLFFPCLPSLPPLSQARGPHTRNTPLNFVSCREMSVDSSVALPSGEDGTLLKLPLLPPWTT